MRIPMSPVTENHVRFNGLYFICFSSLKSYWQFEKHLKTKSNLLPENFHNCMLKFRCIPKKELLSQSMTKPTNDLCAQQRLRSAWVSNQSDQSLLSAGRNLGFLAIHWAHSKDTDQTMQMPWLIWVFAGHTGHFVGFVMLRLSFLLLLLQHGTIYVQLSVLRLSVCVLSTSTLAAETNCCRTTSEPLNWKKKKKRNPHLILIVFMTI